MSDAPAVPTARETGFLATQRKDAWWVGPLLTALGLGTAGIYLTFRAYWGWRSNTYQFGPLLSPLYAPLIVWAGMPKLLSPAFLILWAPGGFRLTCYYYRKAYYRAFFADPVACSVGEARKGYCGETKFPFILQNMHRYFMYLALVFNVILWIDAIKAFVWPDGFHMSVGTLVACVNAFFLMSYTFSCHSLRHLIGGNVDCYSCVALGGLRQRLWKGASGMNENHMFWAWTSLFTVSFADFYVWMVAAGHFKDLRIF